jgi:hypothetical protein
MKTKEEVLKHLAETGYTMKAMNRIFGFLVGLGEINYDEDINIKHGEHKWEHFVAWWNDKDAKKDYIVGDLLEYLAERFVFCDVNEQERLCSFLDFLIDEYGVEVNEDDE